MVGDGWEIVEEKAYQAAINRLGGPLNCDEALAPIFYAIHRNPLGFPEMPGVKNVRIAKTMIKITSAAVLPAMRL